MAWEVEVTDEFKAWWDSLDEFEQASVSAVVRLLVEYGPSLPFPYSSKVLGSRHSAMREMRVQHRGKSYRLLYIFDPRRTAILLVGGDKTGHDRWYEQNVPLADDLYDACLKEIQKEPKEPDDA